MIFAVSQDKEVNERLGKIKRANSNFRMSTAASYVSKEQPSIVDDCAVAAENMMLMADSLGYPRKEDNYPAAKPRKNGRILRF